MFRKAFQVFLSVNKNMQSKPPISFYQYTLFAPSSNQYGAAHSVQSLVYMLKDFPCPSVINSLYWSDILWIMFFLKFPQNTSFIQYKKSHFIPIKMKGIFYLLMDDTFHCKWYCTRSESQNKDFFS